MREKPDESDQSIAGEIIGGASNLFGAFTGATLTAIDPTMAGTAGIAGALAEETVKMLLGRVVGHKDRRRMSSVVIHARDRYNILRAHGATIREDDFWKARGDIPPAGQEVFEAVLLAAQKNPEERKIRYMGNLFAYIACDPKVTEVSAHWLVKTAESLSWTQFELLALVNRIDEIETTGVTIGEAAMSWDSFALHRELVDLGDGEKRLITGKMVDPENMGLEFPSQQLSDQSFTESGRLLAFSLGIEEIAGSHLDDLVRRLRRTSEDGTSA